MPIPLFLAMSSHDFSLCRHMPPKVAWMSVHFSPSGSGLANRPKTLPQGSLVLLDDMIPWSNHNPSVIVRELEEILLRFKAAGLLLDFERPPAPETLLLAEALGRSCRKNGIPVAAPRAYLTDLYTEEFLPPVPVFPARNHIVRKYWKDLSLFDQTVKIGSQAIEVLSGSRRNTAQFSGVWQKDPAFPCIYHAQMVDNDVHLSMKRNYAIVQEYLQSSQDSGVRFALGLWKEFRAYGQA